MTVRPGQFGSLIGPSQPFSVIGGRFYALNNSAWGVLCAVHVFLTTTVTVGSRLIVLRVVDAAGNRLFASSSSAVAANSTLEISWGAGIAAVTANLAGTQLVSLPVEMPIPPLAQIQVFDFANVDTSDTQQVNATFAI